MADRQRRAAVAVPQAQAVMVAWAVLHRMEQAAHIPAQAQCQTASVEEATAAAEAGLTLM
jgi:hypothetical protein